MKKQSEPVLKFGRLLKNWTGCSASMWIVLSLIAQAESGNFAGQRPPIATR
jgi:hypothetical protein